VATPVSLPILEQGGVNQRSPAQAKIALFRSLFHGREDVYPQRFESRKTGQSWLFASSACLTAFRSVADKHPLVHETASGKRAILAWAGER